jgi:hypothetical protein
MSLTLLLGEHASSWYAVIACKLKLDASQVALHVYLKYIYPADPEMKIFMLGISG